MRIDKYLLFADADAAEKLLRKVNTHPNYEGGDPWSHPNVNPFDERAIVPWNDEYLSGHDHLIEDCAVISHTEALSEGWSLGYHRGLFAKARRKIEEAETIRAALGQFDRQPNFPAYRALFFGLLSALYATKEAVSKSCKRIGPKAEEWWEMQWQKIRNDGLLWFLYNLNNTEKHELASPYLKPRLELERVQVEESHVAKIEGRISDVVVSGEGVFFVVDEGTPRERRVFFEGAEARFEPYLDTKNLTHKGKDVSNLPLQEQIDLALTHYRKIIFEARRKFEMSN